jgi:hypothetical protein
VTARRMTRRALLGAGVGVAAVSVPVIASALTSRASAATGLPMTIVNQTGTFANNQIRLYVVGTDPGGRQGYVRQNGVFTPCALSDNGPDGFADLSLPLASTGTTTLTLPAMSGRVYFAVNAPLKFKVVADGAGRAALQFPAGWVDGDPSFNVLHDCWEFTYNDAGMFCNTTMVDMFSIPMALRLTGSSDQSTGTLTAGGRDRIFAAMAAQPGFSNLVIGDKLRVIAPGHGIAANRFSSTYFDGYVEEVWNKYATTDLRVTTNSGLYTGRVSGGKLVFDRGVAPFSKPTTSNVLFCDGALAAPNDGVTGPVAAVLGAGFNRSVLVSTPNEPVTDPGAYYKTTVSNHYSRIIHENVADGRAYGFAFDDVADHASYIQDTKPSGITVTLTPFGSGNPDPGPTATKAGSSPTLVPPPATTAAGARDAYGRIEAETFGSQSGVGTEACAEGGRNIAWLANGDWVGLGQVAFGPKAATRFQIRAASGAAAGVSGLIEVRLGSRTSAPVGSIAVAGTGGWQTWKTIDGVTSGITGTHPVFLTFTRGQPADFVNVNWLTFAR